MSGKDKTFILKHHFSIIGPTHSKPLTQYQSFSPCRIARETWQNADRPASTYLSNQWGVAKNNRHDHQLKNLMIVSTNSPCQPLDICIQNSIENTHTP